jgi:hypothetical protein
MSQKSADLKTILVTAPHDYNSASFDIPTDVNMNTTVLWDVTPYSMVYTSTLEVETSVYKHQPSQRRIPEDGFQVNVVSSNVSGSYETPQLPSASQNAANFSLNMAAPSRCCNGDEMNGRWMRVRVD